MGWISAIYAPPHWWCIQYPDLYINFTGMTVIDSGDLKVQTVKNYKIQTSIDGTNWTDVCTGLSQPQSYYEPWPSALINNTFNGYGSYLRFYIVDKYVRGDGIEWATIYGVKIYGDICKVYPGFDTKPADIAYGYV